MQDLGTDPEGRPNVMSAPVTQLQDDFPLRCDDDDDDDGGGGGVCGSGEECHHRLNFLSSTTTTCDTNDTTTTTTTKNTNAFCAPMRLLRDVRYPGTELAYRRAKARGDGPPSASELQHLDGRQQSKVTSFPHAVAFPD
eukprot:2224834-Rhodomonas_salina.6